MNKNDFMAYFNFAYGGQIGNKLGLLISALIMTLVIAAIGFYITKSISNVEKNSEDGLTEIISIVGWSMFSLAITAGIISIWGF